MARHAELAALDLPDFGLPTAQPSIPTTTYQARIAAAMARAKELGHAALVVYGDREHSANITYLTGYDPRFEETLLVLVPGRKPTLLLGNEGMSYSAISSIDVERVLYQTFSLLGSRAARAPCSRTSCYPQDCDEGSNSAL